MRLLERSVFIQATPQRVWDVVADIERWPAWTSTRRKVVRADAAPFGLQSRARVWLRRMLAASTWQVTEFTPGRSFTWESRPLPGLATSGGHRVSPEDQGSRVVLAITLKGPLARLFEPFSRRNLALEAEGPKRYCEGPGGATSAG